MSTEQPLTASGETDANQPSTDNQNATDNSSTQATAPSGETAATAPAESAPHHEEEEGTRSSGEDFGQLLDQFEQEQSTLQEGEVVRGTVVGITDRGVVIDFGYKSEGIVNQS
jgi:small subunit ribosomal protein S1